MKPLQDPRINPQERRYLLDFSSNFPVKLGALASVLGVKIKVSRLASGISGQITKETNGYVIRVNRNESRERQRFTIAHELAHYLLHRDIIDNSADGITDNVLYRSGAPEIKEFEANRLAAEIVMPQKLVKSLIEERFDGVVNENSIEQLAKIFEVSKSAMEIRLSS